MSLCSKKVNSNLKDKKSIYIYIKKPFIHEQYILFSQLHELKACAGAELSEQG